MILECKSCQKKFLVPDSAITSTGRLVQCSSCGNKWTQFPPKKEFVKTKKVIPIQSAVKKVASQPSKKKKVKRKISPSIYSKEYLEKKHGITIDTINPKISRNKPVKKSSTSYFGFYSYLFIFLISTALLFGILNLTKEILIVNFPFLEIYIEYLYENLENFSVFFQSLIY